MESVACSNTALEPPCRDLTLPDMTKLAAKQAKRSEKLKKERKNISNRNLLIKIESLSGHKKISLILVGQKTDTQPTISSSYKITEIETESKR